MTEPASDVEVMDVNESDENVVSSSVNADKENGICNESESSDILVKKSKVISTATNNNDVIESNSNHDANMSVDEEVTNSDSTAENKTEEENKNEANSQLNHSGENDSQSAELKESSKTDIVKSPENHKDTDSEVKCVDAGSETPASSDCPSSTPNADKQIISEENSKKPNSIPERLLDESPKNSPETIVADDGPLEGKSKTDDSDAAEVTAAKADDADAKVL